MSLCLNFWGHLWIATKGTWKPKGFKRLETPFVATFWLSSRIKKAVAISHQHSLFLYSRLEFGYLKTSWWRTYGHLFSASLPGTDWNPASSSVFCFQMGDLQWPQSVCLREAPQGPGLHLLLPQGATLSLQRARRREEATRLFNLPKKKKKNQKLGQPDMKEYMGYL